MQREREIAWILKEKYEGLETPAFHIDVERLDAGEPVAYIIGHVPFLDCRIELSSRPLIPRPETEYWTERAIQEIPEGAKVLDLCAGSGCIGIAVLKHVPQCTVHFAEIKPEHCEQISENIRINNLDEGRAKVLQSDLFSNINDTYDFILANPPYIAHTSVAIEEIVKKHEPHEALFAEEEGFGYIRRILKEAPTYLNQNGILYIEHDPEQSTLFPEYALHIKDQFGVERVSRLTF